VPTRSGSSSCCNGRKGEDEGEDGEGGVRIYLPEIFSAGARYRVPASSAARFFTGYVRKRGRAAARSRFTCAAFPRVPPPSPPPSSAGYLRLIN